LIVLIASALLSGLTTAALLAPVSILAALIIAPLAASAGVILACGCIAWRNSRDDLGPPDLTTRTGAMVAVLRDVAQQTSTAQPASQIGRRRPRTA
jgi:hypothetical protein